MLNHLAGQAASFLSHILGQGLRDSEPASGSGGHAGGGGAAAMAAAAALVPGAPTPEELAALIKPRSGEQDLAPMSEDQLRALANSGPNLSAATDRGLALDIQQRREELRRSGRAATADQLAAVNVLRAELELRKRSSTGSRFLQHARMVGIPAADGYMRERGMILACRATHPAGAAMLLRSRRMRQLACGPVIHADAWSIHAAFPVYSRPCGPSCPTCLRNSARHCSSDAKGPQQPGDGAVPGGGCHRSVMRVHQHTLKLQVLYMARCVTVSSLLSALCAPIPAPLQYAQNARAGPAAVARRPPPPAAIRTNGIRQVAAAAQRHHHQQGSRWQQDQPHEAHAPHMPQLQFQRRTRGAAAAAPARPIGPPTRTCTECDKSFPVNQVHQAALGVYQCRSCHASIAAAQQRLDQPLRPARRSHHEEPAKVRPLAPLAFPWEADGMMLVAHSSMRPVFALAAHKRLTAPLADAPASAHHLTHHAMLPAPSWIGTCGSHDRTKPLCSAAVTTRTAALLCQNRAQ
jgi:hypothetical protein